MAEKDDSNASTSRGLYLVTSAAELEAMREPTAGVDLMSRHHLKKYDGEARKTLRRGIAHFLSPQLQVLIREKPRIALSEKADFAELLSEEPSGRPIQELSVDLLRRSFMIRRRVVRAGEPNEEEDTTGPPIPPDLPMAEQTTNKLSSAFSKKQAKRARPLDEGTMPPSQDLKFVAKPLISKLMAMKWAGWGNPFNTVLKKSNAPHRYFEYIKRPMNLTYIRDNISKNRYTKLEDIEADLELVVSNAMTFNPTSDPVHQYALELRAAFREELPLLKRTLGSEETGQVDKKPRVR